MSYKQIRSGFFMGCLVASLVMLFSGVWVSNSAISQDQSTVSALAFQSERELEEREDAERRERLELEETERREQVRQQELRERAADLEESVQLEVEAGFEEMDREMFELEMHGRQLEISNLESEANLQRLEYLERFAAANELENNTKVQLVMNIEHYLEGDEAFELLKDVKEQTKDTGLQKVILLKLAEMHAHENPQKTKEILKTLLLK